MVVFLHYSIPVGDYSIVIVLWSIELVVGKSQLVLGSSNWIRVGLISKMYVRYVEVVCHINAPYAASRSIYKKMW